MIETSEALEERVSGVVRSSPLAPLIREVLIEPTRDEDGEGFLRVVLVMALPDRDVDSELETLLEHIEEAVAAVDDRYPSVRFLDAA